MRRSAPALLTGTLLLALSACKDAPTGPRTLELLADGQEWTAVLSPTGLPSAETWLPFLEEAPAARVEQLLRAADGASQDRRVECAAELRRAADRLAVRSLQAPPDAAVVGRALDALDLWAQRVRSAASRSPLPVGFALAGVEHDRAVANASLRAGDTLQAVALLAHATEQVRQWAPAGVTLRVLERADARLAMRNPDGALGRRVRRLLASSRVELSGGDPVRALREAVYALQMLNGAAVDGPSDAPLAGAP